MTDIACFGPEGDGTPGKPTFASDYPIHGAVGDLEAGSEFLHDDRLYRVRRQFSPKGKGSTTCDIEFRQADHSDDAWEPVQLATIRAISSGVSSLLLFR